MSPQHLLKRVAAAHAGTLQASPRLLCPQELCQGPHGHCHWVWQLAHPRLCQPRAALAGHTSANAGVTPCVPCRCAVCRTASSLSPAHCSGQAECLGQCLPCCPWVCSPELAAQSGPVAVIVFTFVSNCQKCQGVHVIAVNPGQPVFPLWFQSSLRTVPLTSQLRLFGDDGSLLNLYFPCVFINTGGFSIVFVSFSEHCCGESVISV